MNYDETHAEFYLKYVTNREPTPPEWEGRNWVLYKDCDFLHPKDIIRMLPKEKSKTKPTLKVNNRPS